MKALIVLVCLLSGCGVVDSTNSIDLGSDLMDENGDDSGYLEEGGGPGWLPGGGGPPPGRQCHWDACGGPKDRIDRLRRPLPFDPAFPLR